MKLVALAISLSAFCPGKIIGYTTQGTQSEFGGRHIWVDRAEVAQYSAQVREFVIRHECGHTHALWAETSADTYAFNHMKVTKPMIEEMCKLFNSTPDTVKRCTNLRRLYESNR